MPKLFLKKIIFFAAAALIACFSILLPAAAASDNVDDGFGPARKIESRYFTIYYAPPVDPLSLSEKLNVGAGERFLSGVSGDGSFGLGDELDTIFSRVGEILDMHLYSYHGSIKICANQEQLASIYRRIFDKDLGKMSSFYIFSFNTIYISAQNFRRGVIGHEIGHAIMSHYFVVQPSVKVQEILAGYVEYQLRKEAGK